jgi:hypothetical protein
MISGMNDQGGKIKIVQGNRERDKYEHLPETEIFQIFWVSHHATYYAHLSLASATRLKSCSVCAWTRW